MAGALAVNFFVFILFAHFLPSLEGKQVRSRHVFRTTDTSIDSSETDLSLSTHIDDILPEVRPLHVEAQTATQAEHDWVEELMEASKEPFSEDVNGRKKESKKDVRSDDDSRRSEQQQGVPDTEIGLSINPEHGNIMVGEFVPSTSPDTEPTQGGSRRGIRRSKRWSKSKRDLHLWPIMYPIPTSKVPCGTSCRQSPNGDSRRGVTHSLPADADWGWFFARSPVPTPRTTRSSRLDASADIARQNTHSTTNPIPTPKASSLRGVTNGFRGTRTTLKPSTVFTRPASTIRPSTTLRPRTPNTNHKLVSGLRKGTSFLDFVISNYTASRVQGLSSRNSGTDQSGSTLTAGNRFRGLVHRPLSFSPSDLLMSGNRTAGDGVIMASQQQYLEVGRDEMDPAVADDGNVVSVSGDPGDDGQGALGLDSTDNPILHGTARPTQSPTKVTPAPTAAPTAAPSAKPHPRTEAPSHLPHSTLAPTPQPLPSNSTVAPTPVPGMTLPSTEPGPTTTYPIPTLGSSETTALFLPTPAPGVPGAYIPTAQPYAPMLPAVLSTPARPATPVTEAAGYASIHGRDVEPVCVYGWTGSVTVDRSVSCLHRRRRRQALSQEQLTLLLQHHGGQASSAFTAPTLTAATSSFRNMLPLQNHHTARDIHEKYTTKELRELLEMYHQQKREDEAYSQVMETIFGKDNYPKLSKNNRADTSEKNSTLHGHEAELEKLEEFFQEMIPASHFTHHRTKRQTTTGLGYCTNTQQQTATGFLHLCSACQKTTDLGEDHFPRYINEVVCNPNTSENCLEFQTTAHGRCEQSSLHVRMLRRRTGRCMELAYNGQTVLTDEWELYSQEVHTGCQCMLDKRSALAIRIMG